jgi:GNAT superfamily N-acetyltransferase
MNNRYFTKTGKELSPDEIQKVAAIDNKIPEKYDEFFINDDEALKNRIAYFNQLSDEDFFKVVFDEESIIAFHVIKKISKACAYISTLWVERSSRKSGIGRALKAEGLKWAKENGFKYIQTNVNPSNVRMLSINRKNGYEDFSISMRLKL